LLLSAFLLIDIPWFLTEGKLAAIFIKTFSWGLPTGRSFTTSQQVSWHHQLGLINKFSGAVAREEWKTSVRGVFARTSFTLLLFCFTLFILPALFFYQKPKKN
jgi:hypothetical protein